MSSNTVAEFAAELNRPTHVVLEQLAAAGVRKLSGSDALAESDKQRLLSFLQASHGTASTERNKITLTKKSTSEIKQADASGRARTIQVEVRKKRTFVRRDDEPLAGPGSAEGADAAAEAAAVAAAAEAEAAEARAQQAQQAELERREEQARQQAEQIRLQEEELAQQRQARQQSEEREARETQERSATLDQERQQQLVQQRARADMEVQQSRQRAVKLPKPVSPEAAAGPASKPCSRPSRPLQRSRPLRKLSSRQPSRPRNKPPSWRSASRRSGWPTSSARAISTSAGARRWPRRKRSAT